MDHLYMKTKVHQDQFSRGQVLPSCVVTPCDLHPVHFWPKLKGAMRRILVPNLSATFHAPRTKFVHDLKVNQPNSQPNSNKNDRSRKKPTSFWTPHCQLCFRIMRDAKEFSDVTLACGDGQLVEAHKVILAGSGHTSFGLSWGILSFFLQLKICSILKISSFRYQHTNFAHAS